MATTLKTLTLSLDTVSVECQLDQAELVDNPTTEDVVTFCGTDQASFPNYELNLGGFQDWGAVNAVTDLIHDAYAAMQVAAPAADAGEIDFVLTVGSKTRTGVAKPTQDVPFGGTAGSPLKFSVTLSVVGTPTDGDVTP